MSVDIEFDPDKRDRTLAERGLDFACAREVFAGPHLDWPDTRNEREIEKHAHRLG